MQKSSRRPEPAHYEFSLNTDRSLGSGAWVEVTSESLAHKLRLRVELPSGDRLIVETLIVGEGGESVTSETLRSIRIAEILEALVANFDPAQLPEPNPDDVASFDLLQARWDEFEDWARFKAWFNQVRIAPSVETRLERFVRTYSAEYAKKPYGAMTRTAVALGKSRQTAVRYASEARDQGFELPGGEA